MQEIVFTIAPALAEHAGIGHRRWLTAYLEAGGSLENAQAMAAHESPRTTKLYDRTGDEITLDEVERIKIWSKLNPMGNGSTGNGDHGYLRTGLSPPQLRHSDKSSSPMTIEDKALGRRNYEPFAKRYAEQARRKTENSLYERPAMLALMPELRGKRVLDAGCGPGHYAEELLNRGASVVACDVTPEMVALARELVGHRGADVREHDLDKPLTWLDDESIDLVLCALALDYVADLGRAFREFRRLLKPGGNILFSVEHPINTARLHGGRYHETELVGMEWKSFGEPRPYIEMYRRPLQDIISPLLAAGFILERIVEPQPSDDLKLADPQKYERLLRTPYFMCARAKRA